MAELVEQDVKQLFKAWRLGDGASGQAMAQRFTDWYYAITAVRLGDANGREPMERACQSFAKGIMTVTRTSELIDWAHGLVLSEVRSAGGRVPGGDFPNALTNKRSPIELLQAVRGHLSEKHVDLLSMAFDPSVDLDRLTHAAEAQGGMPLALLQARYELKRVLRDHAQVPFSVVPDEPNLDRAPLPIYETARMSSAEEEAYFEKWLITDLDLCKDVAEFATFAHALRAGAFRGATPAPVRRPSAAAAHPAPAAPAADAAPVWKTQKGMSLPILAGVLAIGVVVMLVVGIVAFLFLGR